MNLLIEKIKLYLTPKTKLALDNQTLFEKAVLRPEKIKEIDYCVNIIKKGEAEYKAVSFDLNNGIPWWFIGITHFMEAGFYQPNHFKYHLHCGDPLTGRTFHVPAGRPKFNPKHGTKPPSMDNPYTWKESALDALKYMGYDKVTDWSIGNCLYLFEKFNGMGYRKRGLNSPYVWSYTNMYDKGKYVGDGKYDPNAVSKQPGTAALLKRLLEVI